MTHVYTCVASALRALRILQLRTTSIGPVLFTLASLFFPGERNLGALWALPRRPTFGGGAQRAVIFGRTAALETRRLQKPEDVQQIGVN